MVKSRSRLGYNATTSVDPIIRPPTITVSGSEEQKEKRFKPWNLPVRQPDEHARRIMLREALRVALTLIMKNHVYTFDNEIRKQTRGGPIGLKLTGVLAQIFMIWWDKEFAARLDEMSIVVRMNKRYVDDINLTVQSTPPGMRYKNGQSYRGVPAFTRNTQVRTRISLLKAAGERLDHQYSFIDSACTKCDE